MQIPLKKQTPFGQTSPRFKPNLTGYPGPGTYDSKLKDYNGAPSFVSYAERETTQVSADLGPGTYYKEQPFLKKTFNQTLPLGKFF